MKSSAILALFLIALDFIATAKIDCEFYEHNTNGYACKVENLDTYRIEGVNNNHLPGKTNKDVKFFNATSKSLQFLPRWLHHTFPSLEYISFNSVNFSEILRSDLKDFGENLRTLSLINTQLEDLPDDIFKDTPNLGHLYLESISEFKHINHRIFEDVPKLFFLSVNFPCVKAEEFQPSKIQQLIKNLDIRCFNKGFVHHNLNREEIECDHEGCGSPEPPVNPDEEKGGHNWWMIVGLTILGLIVAAVAAVGILRLRKR